MNSKTKSRLVGSKTPIKQGVKITLQVGCKGVTASAYHKVATRVRRLRRKRSWNELGKVFPGIARATLRKIVEDKSYRPKDPKILMALGLSPLPALAGDVLAIIHGGMSGKLARRGKRG